jgi:hypothetical protein
VVDVGGGGVVVSLLPQLPFTGVDPSGHLLPCSHVPLTGVEPSGHFSQFDPDGQQFDPAGHPLGGGVTVVPVLQPVCAGFVRPMP